MFGALLLQFYTVLGFVLLAKLDGINLVENTEVGSIRPCFVFLLVICFGTNKIISNMDLSLLIPQLGIEICNCVIQCGL